MLKPVNDNIILLKESTDNKTASGIIIDRDNKDNYIVVVTNEHTEGLKGKRVFTSKQPQHLQDNYYSIDYKDIVAFTD